MMNTGAGEIILHKLYGLAAHYLSVTYLVFLFTFKLSWLGYAAAQREKKLLTW